MQIMAVYLRVVLYGGRATKPQGGVMRQGDRAFGGKARGSRLWCTSKIGPTPGGPDFRTRA